MDFNFGEGMATSVKNKNSQQNLTRKFLVHEWMKEPHKKYILKRAHYFNQIGIFNSGR